MRPMMMSDCAEILLDLVCYEIYRMKLSPEMQQLFFDHLDQCPTCRKRVAGYLDLLAELRQQFGLIPPSRN